MAIPEKHSLTTIDVQVKTAAEIGIGLPAPLAAPELDEPLDNWTLWDVFKVTLEWLAVAEAATYEIQVSESASFEPRDTSSVETANLEVMIGNLAWEEDPPEDAIEYPLKADETVYWRVQAINGYLRSRWSDVRAFTIKKTPPEELPDPPYVEEVVPENDEVKPADEDIPEGSTQSALRVFMSDRTGPVDSYTWRCTYSYRDEYGALQTERDDARLSEQEESSCLFTAPTLAAIGIDNVASAAKGVTFTITYQARNDGGTSSKKTDINVRLHAGDPSSEDPTLPGSIFSQEDEE